MVAVGIKELKAKLSEYVRAAHAGETILVTDRGDVVAVLTGASELGRARELDSTEARLAEGVRQGWITRASLPKKGWSWRPRGLALTAGTADRLLADLREERPVP